MVALHSKKRFLNNISKLTAFSVNVFYHVNQEQADHIVGNLERHKQEREFKIGSIGLSDSLGILLASIIAVPTEVNLCKAQLNRGKMLCKGL